MPLFYRAASLCTVCLLAVALTGCEGTQSRPLDVVPFEIVEVVPDVYAALANPGGEGVGNAGIINMGQTVIVFDTGLTPAAGRQLRAAVDELTGNPVRFVMNSHYHDDHLGGNQIFKESSFFGTSATQRIATAAGSGRSKELVGQAKEVLSKLEGRHADDPVVDREIAFMTGYMRGIVDSEPEFERQPPTVVYDNRINFTDTLRQVKFIPVGKAHAEGDAVLWLEADSVLFAGGVVTTDRHPRMQDGDIDGWKDALDELLTLEFNVLIPGHGPLGDRSSVLKMKEYLEFVERSAQLALDGEQIDLIPVDSAFSDWMLETQFRENVRFAMDNRRP